MDKIVRLGCIGCGGFAGTHLAQIKQVENSKVVAIADINPDHLKEKSEEFGIADTYLDYHDLLAREDIDAVILPLPDQVHCQVACDALRAGTPVRCDGVEGASTVSVCTAIVESFKTGEKVTVDYDF